MILEAVHVRADLGPSLHNLRRGSFGGPRFGVSTGLNARAGVGIQLWGARALAPRRRAAPSRFRRGAKSDTFLAAPSGAKGDAPAACSLRRPRHVAQRPPTLPLFTGAAYEGAGGRRLDLRRRARSGHQAARPEHRDAAGAAAALTSRLATKATRSVARIRARLQRRRLAPASATDKKGGLARRGAAKPGHSLFGAASADAKPARAYTPPKRRRPPICSHGVAVDRGARPR